MKKFLEIFNFIKEKFNKKFDIILLIYMILNVLYINVGSCLVTKRIVSSLYFSYGYMIFLVINIFLIKYLVLSKKYKKTKIDLILKLITIFAIISAVFAFDIRVSLYGYYNRYEGLFVILYYMSILFLSTFIKKEHKKILIYSILLGGFIQVIYSIFQKFNLFNVNILSSSNMVYGFTTNPNFFGTLMIFCLSYSIGLFMDSKKIFSNIIFAFLSCSFFLGLLLSNTLSSMVGLIGVLIFLLFYSIKNKHFKKFILLCILLGYIVSTAHFFGMTGLVKDLVKTKNETTNIVKGDLNGDYGTGRVEVWKKAIKISPKYMIHGIGIDNFAYVLNGSPIRKNHMFFDKAHNEYLQILVTMGIFSLLSYLSLHFIIVKNGIKNAFKTHEIYLILPIIGYLIQAQFNISVIEVAPFFYMGLGLLINRK